MRKINFLFLIMALSLHLSGQDIHFSQITASSLTLNPALTGIFKGEYRFTGNYRDQWASVTTPFKTYAASIDFSLYKDWLDKDILGLGILFFTDKAGDSDFKMSSFMFSASYSKYIYNDHYLVVGLQGGTVQRSVNYSNLQFGNQYDGNHFDPKLHSREDFKENNFSYFDAAAGLLWYYTPKYRTNIYGGIALHHTNKAKQYIYDEIEQLHRKLVIHGGAQFILSENMDLLPSIVFYKKSSPYEFTFGSYLKFLMNNNIGNDAAFSVGIWHRYKDAIILATKFEFLSVSLGVSYDINISDLNAASKYKGGPEISLVYTGTIPPGEFKNREIHCPRF